MKITKTKSPKQKPDYTKLGFGKHFTDHMLIMDYKDGAWQDAEIVPYAPFAMDPSTMVLHYAQGLFEGLKAYKNKAGRITLFRPTENIARMNRSAERLCMPQLPNDKVLTGLKELVKTDADWIPTEAGTSLYIRPTYMGTDAMLGVHPSHSYRFFIILSPVGSYYAAGLKPVKILVEEKYVRAVPGGTGEAKCIGNYAASLIAGEAAEKRGYAQALWLDGVERKYIEEVGAMNIFFVIGGTVVTPKLSGSILPGITRKSAIEVLKKDGYKVEERRITIDEVVSAHKDGSLSEVFGTGTAAVISPVGVLGVGGKDLVINGNEMGPVADALYKRITDIQYGRAKDEFGWVEEVK